MPGGVAGEQAEMPASYADFIVKGWCHSPTFFVRENLESRKELS